ncbi:hypothetical protein [uncultured Aquimarina sp.]|uniref:PD-(D/E)XK nuclease domain-containing protein n=1 Tax=uncultured Aquimarina sp. TaxID=575652 RepID=UPI00261B39BC|nr:hypothetical protein [uncultured Aquimarina sp.]
MIKVLVVDDNNDKLKKIKESIINNHTIDESYIHSASCKKDASRYLYKERYDLMILDLVLPVEDGGESLAKNGINFLDEILINPSIKPPIHIVGMSGFKDEVADAHEHFTSKLWNIIDYEETSTIWSDKLNSIIFHLVKIRQQYVQNLIEEQNNIVNKHISNTGLPNTSSGLTIKEVITKIENVVEKSLAVPSKFSNGFKSKNINKERLIITSEYDFQNLMHLIIRPWMPSMEPENIAIVFDGNTKNADFSIKGNKIIIEVKYIDTNGKKNDTLKTLEGLKKFYSENSNVKGLLFIILYENNVKLDKYKIESDFSDINSSPYISVKLIENKLTKN